MFRHSGVPSSFNVDQHEAFRAVYGILCSCGKVYIGVNSQKLVIKINEDWDVCMRVVIDKLAVAECANTLKLNGEGHWLLSKSRGPS